MDLTESLSSVSSTGEGREVFFEEEKIREGDLKRDFGERGGRSRFEGGVSCVCTESLGFDGLWEEGRRRTF